MEADEVLSADRVRAGDVVIAMASSGLHSNGYSLARKVLLEWGHMDLNGHVEELDRTLGEELLEPTRIYARDCLALIAEAEVRTLPTSPVVASPTTSRVCCLPALSPSWNARVGPRRRSSR